MSRLDRFALWLSLVWVTVIGVRQWQTRPRPAAVVQAAAVMPPLTADAMETLVESTAAWHGWRVVGKTWLLDGGWQIHVEVKP